MNEYVPLYSSTRCDAVERKAWARLVKATEVRWREDVWGAAQCEYQREIEAARQALRSLGVDVDALLEEA